MKNKQKRNGNRRLILLMVRRSFHFKNSLHIRPWLFSIPGECRLIAAAFLMTLQEYSGICNYCGIFNTNTLVLKNAILPQPTVSKSHRFQLLYLNTKTKVLYIVPS